MAVSKGFEMIPNCGHSIKHSLITFSVKQRFT